MWKELQRQAENETNEATVEDEIIAVRTVSKTQLNTQNLFLASLSHRHQ